LHAYLGLHILAREIIFVDLAFAQIAALGTTFGLLFGVEVGTPLSVLGALGFTLVGALLFSFTRMEDSPVPQEAIIGIAYVVASAAVILFAGFTPEGAEHIKETLTGTLIWVDWPTIFKMSSAYAAMGFFHFLVRRKMIAVSFAPERIRHLRLWDFLFYVSFGIVISFSVEIAGVLMVFSSLVIPGVVAFLFTNRFGTALVLAWGAGTLAIVGGIAASFIWDLATGPLLVCSFGVVLVLAFVLRRLLPVRTGSEVVVTGLAAGAAGERGPAAGAVPSASALAP
ncbi:MAG TPA: metal ABC transporter permease, partial [Longimicrobiales bacterium]|nr:metal ABC transporter permease [Longimicrobiales bacterium]